MQFFRAYKADLKIPTYFIESTAPDNVDDTAQQSIAEQLLKVSDPTLAAELEKAKLTQFPESDAAVEEIAGILAHGKHPNLVIMVHGFNNAVLDVLKMYAAAATSINGDPAILGRDGLVCVGYRWPSEKMRTPLPSWWSAMATLPRRVLLLGLAFIVASAVLFSWMSPIAKESMDRGTDSLDASSFLVHVVVLIGWLLVGVILMAVLLRAIVYFRDNYRASNYGIPDLIQIVRAIDAAIGRQHEQRGVGKPPRNVELSFIGHSMGGFVVTNTIRALSNVFAVKVSGLNAYGAGGPNSPGEGSPPHSHDEERPVPRGEPPWDEIGNVFVLKRFVLASPDIPAEALLSSRSNFLASSLARFREAYLFSSEGDEVLRQISTLANYFVFPTRSNDYGFRLGNTEILSEGYGIIDPRPKGFVETLRVGNRTLRELDDALGNARVSRHSQQKKTRARLPEAFTYFDCTDYVDEDNDGVTRPLLTFAACNKRKYADATLPFRSHLRLLLAYSWRHKPDVHSGYFEGKLSQQLIYRLACIGYADTMAAFGPGALDSACKEKQIRVLISPALLAPIPSPSHTAPQAV
jgi:esterase/lipase superfamily enzyme